MSYGKTLFQRKIQCKDLLKRKVRLNVDFARINIIVSYIEEYVGLKFRDNIPSQYGNLTERLLAFVPEERRRSFAYLNIEAHELSAFIVGHLEELKKKTINSFIKAAITQSDIDLFDPPLSDVGSSPSPEYEVSEQ